MLRTEHYGRVPRTATIVAPRENCGTSKVREVCVTAHHYRTRTRNLVVYLARAGFTRNTTIVSVSGY